jgi:hypothetical protein
MSLQAYLWILEPKISNDKRGIRSRELSGYLFLFICTGRELNIEHDST